MIVTNATPFRVACATALDVAAREHLVLVVKGTFRFPERDGGPLEPAEAQEEPVLADLHWGKPGFSPPRLEAELARFKPRCDLLVNGTARAPEGRPVERVTVGVACGPVRKLVQVVGDRVWRQAGATVGPSAPAPFTSMPVRLDRAFGGVDDADPEEAQPPAWAANPFGRGWHRVKNQGRIAGRPLPNLEYPGEPVTVPWGDYRPAGLGLLPRSVPQRLRYGGTYDQRWLEEVFPFLPADFDERYHQAAPEDQRPPWPAGGDEVVLLNLTPQGRTRFRLPVVDLPVVLIGRDGSEREKRPVLDTILIEPEERRVCLLWRTSEPLRCNLFEIPEAIVGPMSRTWWRARRTGKAYYRSLGELDRRPLLGEEP
ncbi:MAG: DUF2169 domain-containing protein [Geminicoccaceae bacterium]|nr:DUF2169 domain-containing protein [Geminicoccaceae bacterium]